MKNHNFIYEVVKVNFDRSLMEVNKAKMIIQALAAIPVAERAEIIDLARSLFIDVMRSNEKLIIIQALASIPATERVGVMNLLSIPLLPDVVGNHMRWMILLDVAAIPAAERGEVIRLADQIFTNAMRVFERQTMIQYIVAMSISERAEIIDLASPLCTDVMNGFERSMIIQAITAIPTTKRTEVIGFASQRLTDAMRGFERSMVIQAITAIPVDERGDVLNYMAMLGIPKEMPVWKWRLILEEIYRINRASRPRVIEQLIPLVNFNAMDVPEVIGLINGLKLDFLQGELGEGVIDINVHDGLRDKRTRMAIQSLYAHVSNIHEEKSISNPVSDRAVGAFVRYLRTIPMNETDRRLAERALLGPYQDDESFGPLLDEVNQWSVNGLFVSGKKLIACLWLFACNLTEPEQTNAKRGMISALQDSYDIGARVCNAGKAQRLILSVVSGRLQGVNFELIPSDNISVAQAVTFFFNNEANRAIENRQVLNDAAARFCDLSPRLDRAAFMDEIKLYADRTFEDE